MAHRIPRLLPILWLVSLLATPLWAMSREQDASSSDNMDDLESVYRFLLNGSQPLFDNGAIELAPLTATLIANPAEQVSMQRWSGPLRNVSEAKASETDESPIPYISCDSDMVSDQIFDLVNATGIQPPEIVVLYSERKDHCVISNRLNVDESLLLFTVLGTQSAQALEGFVSDPKNSTFVTILPDQDSLNQAVSADQHSSRSGSPTLPMIVLYSLTSLITALLLFVIVGGAIKARRHPERYGPRAVLRPRQSRARGIAMAMLDTLPIVKFGDPDSKQDCQGREEERNVEMNTPAKTPTVTIEDTTANPSTPMATANTSPSAMAADEALPPAHSAPDDAAAVEGQTRPSQHNEASCSTHASSPLPERVGSSLSCSICTEDFSLGEEVRVLPCDHRFHPCCVDPWLLNVSGTCPLCRIDLRPPQDIAEEEGEFDSVRPNGHRYPASRPRSTIGGMVRGARGFDLAALVSSSREERISMLRRWREEVRRRELAGQHIDHDIASPQRRSVRFSQWLRDGFASRAPTEGAADEEAAHGSVASRTRPRTWVGNGAGAGGATGEAVGASVRNDGRATTWYGEQIAASDDQTRPRRDSDRRAHSTTRC